MKLIFYYVFANRTVLRLLLQLHNFLYELCGLLAIRVNGGAHPKHEILRYQDWFLNKVDATDVVLDIGSNTGYMSYLLGQKAAHVYGIEIDLAMYQIAHKKYKKNNIDFIAGDATTYDYSNCQAIDCVVLSNVLEHLPNRVEFLARLDLGLKWRDAKPSRFLIRVPTIERDWLAPYKKMMGVEYRLDRTHTIEHTRDELFQELTDAGLTVELFESRFGEFYLECKGKTR